MPKKRYRRESQAVEAFSAPRELLVAAQREARRRGLPKSGFYRYCLAKELGYSDADATAIAGHLAVGQFNIVASPGASQHNTFTSAHGARGVGTVPQKRAKIQNVRKDRK